MSAARVEQVCVLHALKPDEKGPVGTTAIDKRPVEGPVPVGELGLAGDRQMDTDNHGGPEKAVYAYAVEDADWWAGQLEREIRPGLFGENLRTRGLDVSGALIGERWAVGDGGLLLEVTMPRTPCMTFTRHMEEQRWVKRFTQGGRPGAYFRVITPGPVAAGDAVQVVHRPAHGVSIAASFLGADPEAMRALLAEAEAGRLDLAPEIRERAEVLAARPS